MSIVTVSSKFQIVIPKSVRDHLEIQPAQKLQVLVHGKRIELLPIEQPQSLRGFLKGIDTTVQREPDRV